MVARPTGHQFFMIFPARGGVSWGRWHRNIVPCKRPSDYEAASQSRRLTPVIDQPDRFLVPRNGGSWGANFREPSGDPKFAPLSRFLAPFVRQQKEPAGGGIKPTGVVGDAAPYEARRKCDNQRRAVPNKRFMSIKNWVSQEKEIRSGDCEKVFISAETVGALCVKSCGNLCGSCG